MGFGKGGGVAEFKLSYNYMKMISLKKCYGENNKWYYNIISVEYFKAIVLLFFVHLSYFPTLMSVLNGLVSHIWEQRYINLRKIGFNIFLF